MSKNVSILIEGVAVGSEGTDDVLAVSQAVGAALKNNGIVSVESISINLDTEPAD